MVVATQGDKVAIVNCGMPDDLTDINRFWEVSFGDPYGKRTQIVRTEEERPLNALASIGIKPEDVDHVIITPMMAYSAAHLTAFPNAVYWLSRKGFVDRIVPRKGVIKVRGGEAPPIANYTAPIDIFLPAEQLHHLLYDAYHRVNFVDEAEVEPGLRIWWAGVHHKGSLAVEIDSTAGTVVASDAFFYYENVENNHYLGVGESYDQAMETYEKARAARRPPHPDARPQGARPLPGRGHRRRRAGARRADVAKVRLAVLGVGSWTAVNHLPGASRAATTSSGSRPSTPTPSDGGTWPARFPFGLVTENVDEALAAGVDAVIVGSTPNAHHALAKAALEAGAHVLCEKPFTTSGREAWELVRLAESARPAPADRVRMELHADGATRRGAPRGAPDRDDRAHAGPHGDGAPRDVPEDHAGLGPAGGVPAHPVELHEPRAWRGLQPGPALARVRARAVADAAPREATLRVHVHARLGGRPPRRRLDRVHERGDRLDLRARPARSARTTTSTSSTSGSSARKASSCSTSTAR